MGSSALAGILPGARAAGGSNVPATSNVVSSYANSPAGGAPPGSDGGRSTNVNPSFGVVSTPTGTRYRFATSEDFLRAQAASGAGESPMQDSAGPVPTGIGESPPPATPGAVGAQILPPSGEVISPDPSPVRGSVAAEVPPAPETTPSGAAPPAPPPEEPSVSRWRTARERIAPKVTNALEKISPYLSYGYHATVGQIHPKSFHDYRQEMRQRAILQRQYYASRMGMGGIFLNQGSGEEEI